MKQSSLDFLDQTLLQFKIESRDDVVELYKLFSAVEIDEYEKIIDSTNDFFGFLRGHLQFVINPKFKVAVESAESIILPMANKFGHDSFEKKFAETVLELSPTRKSDAHILDVGPGKMPYSSLALATETNTEMKFTLGKMFCQTLTQMLNFTTTTHSTLMRHQNKLKP